MRQFRHGMATIAANDKWGFASVNAPGEPLIVMRMTREHSVRPNSHLRTC